MLSKFQRISILSILLTSLIVLFAYRTAYAGPEIIITGVPQAKEVIVVPRGYLSCMVIPAGFEYGVWKDQRKVCRYPGGVWTSGYWVCTKFRHHRCAYWSWEPSRWEMKQGHGHHYYGPPGPPPRY